MYDRKLRSMDLYQYTSSPRLLLNTTLHISIDVQTLSFDVYSIPQLFLQLLLELRKLDTSCWLSCAVLYPLFILSVVYPNFFHMNVHFYDSPFEPHFIYYWHFDWFWLFLTDLPYNGSIPLLGHLTFYFTMTTFLWGSNKDIYVCWPAVYDLKKS